MVTISAPYITDIPNYINDTNLYHRYYYIEMITNDLSKSLKYIQ